jgi:glycosyltransferase involved in cell wall biosynthesis
MQSGISVLILTYNEERNISRCLDAVGWSDDIVVLDSGSTDRTVKIARAHGGKVYERAYDDERSQRSFSLTLPFQHEWVFNPDADEIATPELAAEMSAAVQDTQHVAYRMRRKDMFMGRWLKHSSLYPTWFVRLFRPAALTFERVINPVGVIHGSEGYLREHLIHYSFNKGLDEWVSKHNRYSHLEAIESLESILHANLSPRSLFSRNPVERRRALKELSVRLPGRPQLRFIYMYLIRGGFMDGRAGYHYCRLLSFYEYLICLKIKELQRYKSGVGL